MSIILMSHRLVFPKESALPLDIEDRMKLAFDLGMAKSEALSKLRYSQIEAGGRKLPDELCADINNFALSRAIGAAYYHGISSGILRIPRLTPLRREEGKKLGARTQRLILQLILSVNDQELERIGQYTLPGWLMAFTGALSVARVAVACHKAGLQVRYPRPGIDVLYGVDLFCSVNPQLHLVIQVKTHRYSGAFVINRELPNFWKGIANRFRPDSNLQYEVNQFIFGLAQISDTSEQFGAKIVPVWAFCSKHQSGLDCGELRADFNDIAGMW